MVRLMRGGKAKAGRVRTARMNTAHPASGCSGIAEKDIIDGLAKIAADEGAPVTARVSAYGLLGKHFGLFQAAEDRTPSDLEALLRELAERDGRNARRSPRAEQGEGGDGQ